MTGSGRSMHNENNPEHVLLQVMLSSIAYLETFPLMLLLN